MASKYHSDFHLLPRQKCGERRNDMRTKAFHSATITVRLPRDMSAEDEIAALRAAGIPVDSQCNAKYGLLFIRSTKTGEANLFRWFARDIGVAP
jgi:hypothetical protein